MDLPYAQRSSDPEIATVANLTNAANSILIPPIGVYSRKPVLTLPRHPVTDDIERMSIHEDELDRHVEQVLTKRMKAKRILRGVWAFVKTRQSTISTCKLC